MKTYGQYFTTDENGIQVFNPFDYLDFYEANIHSYNIYKSEVDELKIYEGMTAEELILSDKDKVHGGIAAYCKERGIVCTNREKRYKA